MTNDVVGLVFCGALGVLTFFVAFLFIRNRERIYAYYALFLVFMLIYGFINIQTPTKLDDLFNNYFRGNRRLIEPVTILSFSFYIFFALELLNIKQQSTWMYRVFLIWGISCILYSIGYFILFDYLITFNNTVFAFARVVIFSLSFFLLTKVILKIGSPIKKEFVWGTFAYFIGSVVATVRFLFHDLPFPAFYEVSAYIYFLVGVLIETLFFASALGHRIYYLNQQKQANKEKLLAEMIKNDSLTKTMNEWLEAEIKKKEEEIIDKQQALKKQEKQLLEMAFEKKLVQSEMLANRLQMNPHFIFNCLNSIKHLIQTSQNEKAKAYLVLFSRFIRKILDTSSVHAIPLHEELEITTTYLQLEKNRFNDDFSYALKNRVDTAEEQILVPPLLLQPFVENAIWHGLLNSEKATKEIVIEIYRRKQNLVISIIDNGIGRARAHEINKSKLKRSTGLEQARNRMSLLSRYTQRPIQFQIKDNLKNGQIEGTIVEITATLDNHGL